MALDIPMSNEAEGLVLSWSTDVGRRLRVSEHLTAVRWSGTIKEYFAILS